MTRKVHKNHSKHSVFSDLKYVICVLLIVSYIGCCMPFATTYAFEGNEDATNPNAFATQYEQTRFKIWSILRSYGLSEAQAIGVIANIDCEGGMYGYKLEKDHEVDLLGEPGVEKAIAFTTQHDEYTVAVLKKMGISDEDIEEGRSDRGHSVNGIIVGGYFDDSPSHLGYCGVGMFQWTGDNVREYFEWCSTYTYNWYDVDVQLTYLFTPGDKGGNSWYEECVDDFIKYSKGSDDPAECAKYWCQYYERPGDPSSEHFKKEVAKRENRANEILDEFKGKSWDSTYGSNILNHVGITTTYSDDGVVDFGILHEYSSPVLQYPQNGGYLLTKEYGQTLDDKNKDVYIGYVNELNGETNTSKQYSLYELFGEDIHWYRYFGEETYSPRLYDHIFSAYVEDKMNKLGLGDTIFYDNNNYLSCSVYPNRPIVLSNGDLFNGYADPRVDAMNNGRFNGYAYEVGSFFLMLSKYITSFISMLMGKDIMIFIKDTVTNIETSYLWQQITPALMFFLGLAMLMFIISIVGKGLKYAKGNGGGMKDVFIRFFVGCLCLGIFICSIWKPAATNNIVFNLATSLDTMFNATLMKSFENDDIIGVSDPDYAQKAAIWKIAIFGPWCRGQFEGRNYDELYTQYAQITDKQSRMPQSTEVIDPSDRTGKAYYNSSKYTGDVSVPVGGGKEIRNWAAYLYSCGSKYHIDSTVAVDPKREENVSFPMANTTFGDSSLMADTFRVIDAQMNISPQHYVDGTISYNYMDSNDLDPHYIRESLTSLFNSFCLFMMLPAIFLKLKSFFLMIALAFQTVYYTIMELFREGEGMSDLGKNMKKCLIDFLVALIRLYIMIILYVRFVDRGFILALVYIILCLVVYGFNVEDAQRFAANTKTNIKKIKSAI